MASKIEKYKPAVRNTLLLLIAGVVWIVIGIMLMGMAFSWLSMASGLTVFLFSSVGIVFALLAHHFGFLRIVDKNSKRILLMNENKCLFAFIPWKSYLLISVMVTMGSLLRHSEIPKNYLAILYIGIGFALILSSVRYLRLFIKKIRK